MHRSLYVSLALVVCSVGPAPAQTQSFGAAVSGFVFNPGARTVRPIVGVRGAAQLGAAVLDQTDIAWVAPGGRAAIAGKNGRTIVLRDFAETAVDGLIDSPDRVAWSSGGSYAVLYSSATGRLQRLRFTPDAALADPPSDLSQLGRVSALAIDVTGRQIAIGIADAGLYLVNDGQSPALISSTAQPAAAAFDDSSQRLYALDLEKGRIIQFEPGAGEAQFASLDQMDPASLAVSGNGQYLLVTDRAARAVQVFDIASRTLANTITLDFAPSRLERLSNSPVFLLNGDNPNEWLLVLDASQTPGVYFVPAPGEEGR